MAEEEPAKDKRKREPERHAITPVITVSSQSKRLRANETINVLAQENVSQAEKVEQEKSTGEKVENQDGPAELQSISRRITVPKGGVILGDQGHILEGLITRSGAGIRILRDPTADPNLPSRLLEITGSLDCVDKAEKLIRQLVEEADAGGSRKLASDLFTCIQNKKLGRLNHFNKPRYQQPQCLPRGLQCRPQQSPAVPQDYHHQTYGSPQLGYPQAQGGQTGYVGQPQLQVGPHGMQAPTPQPYGPFRMAPPGAMPYQGATPAAPYSTNMAPEHQFVSMQQSNLSYGSTGPSAGYGTQAPAAALSYQQQGVQHLLAPNLPDGRQLYGPPRIAPLGAMSYPGVTPAAQYGTDTAPEHQFVSMQQSYSSYGSTMPSDGYGAQAPASSLSYQQQGVQHLLPPNQAGGLQLYGSPRIAPLGAMPYQGATPAAQYGTNTASEHQYVYGLSGYGTQAPATGPAYQQCVVQLLSTHDQPGGDQAAAGYGQGPPHGNASAYSSGSSGNYGYGGTQDPSYGGGNPSM